MRLGLGLDQLGGGVSGASYSAEAVALFARMSTQPDDTRKAAINTLILALKAAGSWAKMDALYLCAAHEQPSAKLNWIADQYNITDPGTTAPTFTTDRGFTGDGSSDYLDTGFNPATAVSPKYVRDSNHMGVWVGTNVGATLQWDVGTARSYIDSLNTTNQVKANSSNIGSNVFAIAANSSIGWTAVRRDNGANYQGFRDGAAPATVVVASTAGLSLPFYLLATSTTGPVPQNYSTRRVQAFHYGSAMTDGEMAATYTALAAYMTAVGA